MSIQTLKSVTLDANLPSLRLDRSANDNTILLLDGANQNGLPESVVNGSKLLDLSGNELDAEFVISNSKLSLLNGIKFADDNVTDYLKVPGLVAALTGKSFAVSVMYYRKANPGGVSASVFGIGAGAGASLGLGFQPSSSQQTFVRDTNDVQAFAETQWTNASGSGYDIMVQLGLNVQIIGADTLFEAYKQNDDFTEPIKDGSSLEVGVQGVFASTVEANIGAVGSDSTPNFRGYICRIVIEDIETSGITATEFLQREWDQNRDRFAL